MTNDMIINNENVIIITLKGRIQSKSEIYDFESQVRLLKDKNYKKLIIDLKYLDWIGSDGLGSLIYCLTSFRNIGGEGFLSNLNDKVKHIFNLTKLDTVFRIFESTELAIQHHLKISN